MSEIIGWIGMESDTGGGEEPESAPKRGRSGEDLLGDLPAHQFSRRGAAIEKSSLGLSAGLRATLGGVVNANLPGTTSDRDEDELCCEDDDWISSTSLEQEELERRVYRWRTIRMLQRYMRYAHDTGRLPSILGREFFRAKVSARSIVTFEERMIYVHDMETCLDRLDEFSQQLIARHILQEHDQLATAGLLGCSKRTVNRYVPIALDLLSEILLDVGLLERTFPIRETSCQGGKIDEMSVSDSQESKNKF